MSQRPLLDRAHVTERVATAQAAFYASVLDRVRAAIAEHPVVVVGMAWNPHVRKAREALDGAGIPHHYIELGSYVSAWRERLAIKMWSGWPTFPQVFVRGVLFGGNRDLRAGLEDGSVRAALDATGS
ncbi:MAG TPA: glutaredoxin [Myxococcota bacterium]|nr:glutaredoxin [Myxococcota bacterium]